jgi:hypothetical protein
VGAAYLRALTRERPLPTIAAHLRLRIDAPGRPEAHIAGSVDEVTAVLQRYRQAGLAYLICDFVADGVDDLLRQMRVMAEQIMPALAA